MIVGTAQNRNATNDLDWPWVNVWKLIESVIFADFFKGNGGHFVFIAVFKKIGLYASNFQDYNKLYVAVSRSATPWFKMAVFDEMMQAEMAAILDFGKTENCILCAMLLQICMQKIM